MRKLLDFYEFIFYKIYQSYIRWSEIDVPGIYALAVITVLQVLNLLTILVFTEIAMNRIFIASKYLMVITTLLFLITNYLYIYVAVGKSNIISKWRVNELERNGRLRFIMIIYFVLTFLFFAGGVFIRYKIS